MCLEGSCNGRARAYSIRLSRPAGTNIDGLMFLLGARSRTTPRLSLGQTTTHGSTVDDGTEGGGGLSTKGIHIGIQNPGPQGGMPHTVCMYIKPQHNGADRKCIDTYILRIDS